MEGPPHGSCRRTRRRAVASLSRACAGRPAAGGLTLAVAGQVAAGDPALRRAGVPVDRVRRAQPRGPGRDPGDRALPRAIFDFNVGVLRWSWRVAYYSYGALATDRYPPFSLSEDPTYPAHFDVEYPEHLSRGLVLVKWWLLAIPHYIVVGVFLGSGTWAVQQSNGQWQQVWGGGLVGILVLVAAVLLAVTGSYPRPLYDLLLGVNRWVLRVAAYVALMTDDYPPFRLDMGGQDPDAALQVPGSPSPVPDVHRDVAVDAHHHLPLDHPAGLARLRHPAAPGLASGPVGRPRRGLRAGGAAPRPGVDGAVAARRHRPGHLEPRRGCVGPVAVVDGRPLRRRRPPRDGRRRRAGRGRGVPRVAVAPSTGAGATWPRGRRTRDQRVRVDQGTTGPGGPRRAVGIACGRDRDR